MEEVFVNILLLRQKIDENIEDCFCVNADQLDVQKK